MDARTARRAVVLIAVLAIALTGCGKKSKTFTSGQLGGFMLTQADVPDRLRLLTDGSGPRTLDDIVSTDEERAKFTSLSFQGAYQATFVNESAAGSLANNAAIPNDAEFVGSFAVVFKTADGAHSAFVYETERDRKTGKDFETIDVPKLGDETIAESGTTDSTDPFPGYLVYWRSGNALFVVIVAGNESALDVSSANAIKWAKLVNARANG